MDWTYRNFSVKLNVGLSSTPYENPVCFTSPDFTGWFNCDTPLIGDYVGLSKFDDNALTISELFAFSYYYISENYLEATLSTTHPGSAPGNAL
jgi:hypothetical protein